MERTSTGFVEIPLTQGYVALVDFADADLASYKWHTLGLSSKYGPRPYASRNNPFDQRPQKILLHRVILARVLERDLSPKEEVDHRDGNGLNNSRSNLRLATHTENGRNTKKVKNTSSRFKGVYWRKESRKWHASIVVNQVPHYLGLFDTEDQAGNAYRQAAEKYFGEFASPTKYGEEKNSV